MSNNAVEAYNNGEMPLSKWNKSEIINAISEIREENIDLFKKLTTKTLKDCFLKKSSWHHTSYKFNETDFYSINEEKVEDISLEELQNLVGYERSKRNTDKVKNPPTFITALVSFDNWEGTGRRAKKTVVNEIVFYKSDEKTIKTSLGNKRLTSLFIHSKIEQKTKFATKKQLEKKIELKKLRIKKY